MNDRTQIIELGSSEYPSLLAEIPKPPQQLYANGVIPDGPALAVVGTRLPTAYGKQITPRIVSELVAAGFTIISGLAYGIDALAHQAALDSGGKTIAVLGTGIDDASIYPRKHVRLAHRIIESGGAVLSEYPEGTSGRKYHFPARNRIVSGLSLGVIVIEAKQKSGALITAKHALDQNRDVFAVPGPISSPQSVGPNMLIAEGAMPLLSPANVIDFYGQTIQLFEAPKSSDATFEEQRLLDAVADRALHVDAIAETIEIEASHVLVLLTQLELRGLIKNVGGGTYIRS